MAVHLEHLKDIGLTDFPGGAPPLVLERLFPIPNSTDSAANGDAVLAEPAAAKAAVSSAKQDPKSDKAKGDKAKGDKAKGAKAAKTPAPEADASEAPADFTYLSEEAVAKLSKAERGAYWQAKRAYEKAQGTAAEPKKQAMTKAERREIQQKRERQKEEAKQSAAADAEALEEMKMQGLTEEAAREFLAAMAQQEAQADDDDDAEDEAPQDFLGAVRAWMQDQPDIVTEDAVKDFNLKVRFQGHVDTLPPDHLGAILRNMVEGALASLDLNAPKLQPTPVSKQLKPALDRWEKMLQKLYGKIDDVIEAADVILRAVQEGVAATTTAPESAQECAVVGCLMAIRGLDDLIEDEDLLTGCRRASRGTPVMLKFIEFLEEEVADDDDEDDEDDD